MEEKREIGKSRLQIATDSYVESIRNYAVKSEIPFTKDETQRIMNAIRTVDGILQTEGLSWATLSRNNVESVLQQVAFLKVNPSAMPRECYFILRNRKTKEGAWVKDLEFGIEGAGNDAILRHFGVDVREVRSYVVYEGDEFEKPYYDGWEVKLPKYRPLNKTKKPLYAVYLIKTSSGYEVSIAEREEVKTSLLAHIRQNGVSETRLRELEKYSLDDLLTKDEFVNEKVTYTVKKQENGKWVEKTQQRDMIGLAWTSSVSREKVVERKLRNIATRKFPKDFSHTDIETLYEKTFEEEKYNNNAVIDTEEIIIDSEIDYQDNANAETIPNESELNVSDDFVVVSETENKTETVVEPIKKTKRSDDTEIIKEYLAQEKAQAEKPKETKQEVPDWF